MKNITKQEIVNRLIEVGKKYKVFTIKDMAEMDLNNNHRLFCYPCDLFYRANKEEE